MPTRKHLEGVNVNTRTPRDAHVARTANDRCHGVNILCVLVSDRCVTAELAGCRSRKGATSRCDG